MEIFKDTIFDGIIGTVLDMSLTGAVIILITAVLRLVMKKLPRRYCYMLWIIPAVRLICPVSFASEVSVFNLVETPSRSYIEEAAVPAYETQVIYELPEETVTLPHYEIEEQPQIKEELYTAVPAVKKEASARDVLTAVWLTGAAAMMVYIAFSYGRTWECIKNAKLLKGNIYECGSISSPFVFGFAKPKIYIPDGISEGDMVYILAHENAHISRGDHIAKLIATFILAVHWFNPAVWLGFKLMTEDMELSCDEKALGSYEIETKKAYAATLLNMSMKQNGINFGGMLSFGESSIKARIKGVLAMKKPKTIACAAAIIVIITAAVCLLTNAAVPSYKMRGYDSYRLVSDTNERQAVPDDEDIRELIEIVDGIKVNKSDFFSEKEADVCIKLYKSDDACGEYSELEFYETEHGCFMTFTESAGTTGYFPFETKEYEEAEVFSYEISEHDFGAVSGHFNWIKHDIFTGVIAETAGNTYIVEADGGQTVTGRVFVSLNEPAEVGDRVRVCFKGGIMETSPQQIDQVYANVISAERLDEGTYYNRDFSADAHFIVSGNKMQFIGARSDFEKIYDSIMPDSDEKMRSEWIKNAANSWKDPVEFYISNVSTGDSLETEIIFDASYDSEGNLLGSVGMDYIDENTIEYCGVRFFRNGTSAWYDVERLNSDRPDTFRITETEEGFEARSEDTDIYIFFTPNDGDELVLRCDGKEKRIPFIGGFYPDYTYCEVSDIT